MSRLFFSGKVTKVFDHPWGTYIPLDSIDGVMMADENTTSSIDEVMPHRNIQKDQDLGQVISGLKDLFLSVIERWRPVIEWGALYLAASEPMKAAGIIPHRSAPWNEFDHSSADEFPRIVLKHYEDNWDHAEGVFLDDIASLKVSDEAKESFKEALCCHRHGFYRASVLTLLPTIEREFRLAAGKGPGGKAASLEELRIAINTVPAGVVLRPVAPLYLSEILDQHIYKNLNTPEEVELFSKNPIPNRHAAIHGHVSYTSSLNSLNTIILAEYVFFAISQIMSLIERQKNEGIS